MFEAEKIWILENILSGVKGHNSAKLMRESLFKVLDGLSPLVTASGAGLYNQNITPTSLVPEIGDKVFLVTQPGTYVNFGSVILPANQFGFIFKNGNNYSIQSIKLPIYDDTVIKKMVTDNDAKVNDFIKNFAVTTDTEFNLQSSNPIANSAVTPLYEVLYDFLNPTVEVVEEIKMPQSGESVNEFVNYSFQPQTLEGAYNGRIKIADLKGFDKIKLTGLSPTFAGGGAIYLAGYNEAENKYERILMARDVKGVEFEIDINHEYEGYIYSRNDLAKFFKLANKKGDIEKNSVKKYIDSNVGTGSLISLKKTAKIAYPDNLVELNFVTDDALPTSKPTLAKGTLSWTDNAGTSFKKFATLEVQGSSSAVYPKKNWTFSLFNEEDFTDSFKIRIGNWVYHSEFVFKSNWIDATHCRNIVSNKIWEDIIQERKYYPKRENEIVYKPTDSTLLGRFDSGALCHVDGFPAKLLVNGSFYGIGMFNIGKKRDNYDIISSNQNHIQLAAELHVNLYNYIPEHWEIRNPKTPDANFTTKINAWFASNSLTGQAFKDNFEVNHDLKNAIDFYLLAEFICARDMFDKNFILTSWDGVKFYFLPYDMDTTFGLEWDGASFTPATISIRAVNFWQKFYNAFSVEIKARYKELKNSDILTLNNVYKHSNLINKTFGVELFKEEFTAWTTVPSNTTILTSYPQIYQWTKDRIIWLDSQYL